uniref:Uncharacterized protein n=1 Tax=Anopheles albimanus TaxID=7167 RepID=A0A182F752_ANOAL
MASYWMSCLLVLVLLLEVVSAVDAENHCSEHRYAHSLHTHHLQFTKEIPDREYAALQQFKSLHCCAKGYRSIECSPAAAGWLARERNHISTSPLRMKI